MASIKALVKPNNEIRQAAVEIQSPVTMLRRTTDGAEMWSSIMQCVIYEHSVASFKRRHTEKQITLTLGCDNTHNKR